MKRRTNARRRPTQKVFIQEDRIPGDLGLIGGAHACGVPIYLYLSEVDGQMGITVRVEFRKQYPDDFNEAVDALLIEMKKAMVDDGFMPRLPEAE